MVEYKVVTDLDLLKYTLFNRTRLAENGCWEWVGGMASGGYGAISRNGKMVRAHRISYEAYKGSIPKGMVVRHMCDNPACINPDHLILGTQKDNAADRSARGRGHKLKGAAIGTAKLTEAQALEIKSSTLSLTELSEKYGVDKSNIWSIRSGKSWKHLNHSSH